ncbi:MAG: response regulator [Bacillota bacterium]
MKDSSTILSTNSISHQNKVPANSTSLDESRKPVVLVIDDDKRIIESFRFLLESESCSMVEASNSEEVIEKIKGKQIDLVITDFMLKTKSSIELFTLIRKANPNTPIVVMTGYPELISSTDIKMFGGNHLMTKPLELTKLRGIIRSYCNPLHVMN